MGRIPFLPIQPRLMLASTVVVRSASGAYVVTLLSVCSRVLGKPISCVCGGRCIGATYFIEQCMVSFGSRASSKTGLGRYFVRARSQSPPVVVLPDLPRPDPSSCAQPIFPTNCTGYSTNTRPAWRLTTGDFSRMLLNERRTCLCDPPSPGYFSVQDNWHSLPVKSIGTPSNWGS